MKKKTQILLNFFEDRFGPLLSETLLEQHFKRLKISSFNNLNIKDQIKYGQQIINDIYKDFYKPDKIQSFKILFLLRFSLNEAIGKIEKMINKTAEIEVMPLTDVELSTINTTLDVIKDETVSKFGFECSNLLDGLLMMTLENKSAVSLAKTLMEIMLGVPSDNNQLDEMKISAVYEFFNILLPDFLEVIGNAYGQAIYFTPLYYNDFNSKYFYEGEFITPQKVLKSEIKITIDKVSSSWSVFFFIKQADENFDKLVDQTKSRASDPFEQSPAKILVERTGNKRYGLENFLKLLNLRPSDIDFVLEKMNASPLLENMNILGKNEFIDLFIEHFFQFSSNNKKETIKKNIDYIFGFDTSK